MHREHVLIVIVMGLIFVKRLLLGAKKSTGSPNGFCDPKPKKTAKLAQTFTFRVHAKDTMLWVNICLGAGDYFYLRYLAVHIRGHENRLDSNKFFGHQAKFVYKSKSTTITQ